MRARILIVWCALLAGGAWYVGSRKPLAPPAAAAMWTAARALPLNWRLGDGDIVEAAGAPAGKPWAGRYVKHPIDAKKAVTDADLEAEPHVPESGALSLYLLPLAAGADRKLNAGERIDLIEGQVAVVGHVEVAAVRCAASCEAILQVPPEAMARLKNANAATLKWVLR